MPIVAVESVDATRDFYVETLGFTHVMGMVGKDGRLDFVTVVLGDARLMFSRGSGDAVRRVAPKQPVELYLPVADVDAYHATLSRKKQVVMTEALTMQWWGDRTFKILDPNGYELWFYTNVADPVPPQGAKLV
jgi:uncharacterized glyoxalase superfamily protein PhnB